MDNINVATFLEGFRKLVGQPPPPIWIWTDHSAYVTETPANHTLNTDITLGEFLQAFKKIQRNKATGLDGMKAEFILDVGELLHMHLLTTINCILAEGFPEALSISVVHVLFKGGNVSEFHNYRGITIGLILTKLLVMIFQKGWTNGLNNMGCVPRVKLGFIKIIALLTNSSYCKF